MVLEDATERTEVLVVEQSITPQLDRLTRYAAKIGVLLKLEPSGASCRVLIDSSTDLVCDEMILGYIEEEMGLHSIVDPLPCNLAWRRLGIIMSPPLDML